MEKIILPYENDDFTPFPYQGKLTSDNLNEYPNQLKKDILSLRNRTEVIQNNILAFIMKPAIYDSDVSYKKYDIVTDAKNNINQYISLVDDNKDNKLTDTSKWQKWHIPDVTNRSSVYQKTEFVADDNQTEFIVSVSEKYTDVYINGVKKKEEDDYTLKDDLTGLDFNDGLNDGDKVEIIVWTTSSILSQYKIRKVVSSTLMKEMDLVVCLTQGDTVDDGEVAMTLTLPNKPSNGAIIKIVDGGNNAQNRPIKIQRQGAKINGIDDDLIIDVNNFSVILTYDFIKNDWSLSSN